MKVNPATWESKCVGKEFFIHVNGYGMANSRFVSRHKNSYRAPAKVIQHRTLNAVRAIHRAHLFFQSQALLSYATNATVAHTRLLHVRNATASTKKSNFVPETAPRTYVTTLGG
jgi:hypothetical protein